MISAAGSSVVRADMMTFTTNKDSSIFSESNNNNGAGSLYTGAAGNILGIRRALLGFNISAIPAGSTINSVTLTITQTRTGPSAIAEPFEIRPLSAVWGEGTGTQQGVGSTPTASAVTWNSRQFGSNLWATPGGSYGAASGTTTLGTGTFAGGVFTFSSQPGMVADVQSWLNSPGTNNGWILKAVSETTGFGARQISSKEDVVTARRPLLTVNYTLAVVPEPNSFVLLGASAMFLSGFRLGRGRVSQ